MGGGGGERHTVCVCVGGGGVQGDWLDSRPPSSIDLVSITCLTYPSVFPLSLLPLSSLHIRT
jgi:hypothetical protein